MTRYLESETLVGRGSQCTLHLTADYISSQHAILRWSGKTWMIGDLGSRNGTWLNGQKLDRRLPQAIDAGAQICFGRPDDSWEVTSAGPPRVMVVNVVTGEQVIVASTVQGVPSDSAPDVTLYQNTAGIWVVDSADAAPIMLRNGQVFDAGHHAWRFCLPDAVTETVTSNVELPAEYSLHFFVSPDEEFVEIQLESRGKLVQLGSRVQNHLLLTLARARLSDRSSNLPETSCGWLYKEDLVSGFQDSQRIDVDVFRIRKHLASTAPDIAPIIIERRPRTRQLRIGLASLKITKT